MPIAKKTCRVCGKPYEACRSAKRGVGVFHWQEVACSPECGTKYLDMVNTARSKVGELSKSRSHVKKHPSDKTALETTPTTTNPLDE